MMKHRKILCLILCLALLVAPMTCAFGEEAERDEGKRRLRLGSSFYSILIDDAFEEGDMTEADIADEQVGYYVNAETGLDFDVYQIKKDELYEQSWQYVLREAMEYETVTEVRPREHVGDIEVAWYRAVETFDGTDYRTLTCILDDGDEFLELVFWLENEEDDSQAQQILNTLQAIELQTIHLGDSPFTLVLPEDFQADGMALETEEGDLTWYYSSEQTSLEFDVYQFGKEGLPETLSEYVLQEAFEYTRVSDLVTDGEINGVPVGWYRTVEAYDGIDYETLTCIMDAGDSYVEVVFWLDGPAAEAQANSILYNLGDDRLLGEDDDGGPELPIPEGVVPVTWEITPEHPMIDTDEARALYQQILAGDYPTMEELLENPVVHQLDALAAYYKALYGNTAEIDTPEREQLRQDLKDWFLSRGSARTERVDDDGRHHYVYDGPLSRDFEMELVLGLPASGKSTRVADPDSEAMDAFILDVDMIKERLPEYVETHGAGADAVHFEGMAIFQQAIDAFLTGDMKGVNIVLPIVGGDLEEMLQQFVLPFEAAGYTVKVKFCEAKENEAAARVVMRELSGGQLINSAVAFNFGEGPENVYNALKEMTSANGVPYVDDEEALEPAA